MNRAHVLAPNSWASIVRQETVVDSMPEPSAPDVSPEKARRSLSGVRGSIVVIACCSVLMWASRTLWDSQRPVISERYSAAHAVAPFGPEAARAIPQLRDLQNDPDPHIRRTAAQALKELKAVD
jgi:hypothetical protein